MAGANIESKSELGSGWCGRDENRYEGEGKNRRSNGEAQAYTCRATEKHYYGWVTRVDGAPLTCSRSSCMFPANPISPDMDSNLTER